ncbi:hypothetical protein KJ903_01115 [Patescibacteria group bacterium]|nr:hypothetical protein [Patescibacteria group bacterium]
MHSPRAIKAKIEGAIRISDGDLVEARKMIGLLSKEGMTVSSVILRSSDRLISYVVRGANFTPTSKRTFEITGSVAIVLLMPRVATGNG